MAGAMRLTSKSSRSKSSKGRSPTTPMHCKLQKRHTSERRLLKPENVNKTSWWRHSRQTSFVYGAVPKLSDETYVPSGNDGRRMRGAMRNAKRRRAARARRSRRRVGSSRRSCVKRSRWEQNLGWCMSDLTCLRERREPGTDTFVSSESTFHH